MPDDGVFAALKAAFPSAVQEQAGGAVIVPQEDIHAVAAFLRDDASTRFDNLHCVTAVDRNDRMELVYIFTSVEKGRRLTVKAMLGRTSPEVQSLCGLYGSANWLEREVFDMFGVTFTGHPGLKRILNPDDWDGYPLRKDYSHPNLAGKTE